MTVEGGISKSVDTSVRRDSLSVSFNQTLYAGGALHSAHRAALAQKEAAEAALLQTTITVGENVGNAWTALEVAGAAIDAGTLQVQAAQTAFDGVREEATLGARTTLDVLNAEQELLDARATKLQAEAQRYIGVYSLLSSMGLLSVDPQGRILEVNMAGAILLGIQRSRSSSHVFTEFLSEEAQDTFLGFHAEVMSGKCRRHCELTLKPTAQRPALVVRIDATVDEDGLENRMVMTDITEQVQQTQALAAREREQRALLDHVPGVFWIKDPQGQFVAVNHLVQRHEQEAHDIQHIPVASVHAVIQRGGGSSFPA